jgi:hypothetical protein
MAPPRFRVQFSVEANFGLVLKKNPSLCLTRSRVTSPVRHPPAWGHCRVSSGSQPVSDGRPGFGDFFGLLEYVFFLIEYRGGSFSPAC